MKEYFSYHIFIILLPLSIICIGSSTKQVSFQPFIKEIYVTPEHQLAGRLVGYYLSALR